MGDFAFWLFVGTLVVLFVGEPDLHEKLMNYMDDQCHSAHGETGG